MIIATKVKCLERRGRGFGKVAKRAAGLFGKGSKRLGSRQRHHPRHHSEDQRDSPLVVQWVVALVVVGCLEE